MDKITVEIDYDGALDIFLVVLKSQYGDLSPTAGGVPMYSYDKEENNTRYYELRRAYQLVMEYNGIDLETGGWNFGGLHDES
jgi:hypothetical protein